MNRVILEAILEKRFKKVLRNTYRYFDLKFKVRVLEYRQQYIDTELHQEY